MDIVAQLAEGITISRGNNASAIAAAVFLAYDTLLCLDREIQHVWKARWTPVKGLYILSRYYGLAHVIAYAYIGFQQKLSIQYCSHYVWWYAIGGNLVFTSIINTLLILRLVALYHKSTKVAVALVVLFLAEVAAELYSIIVLVSAVNKNPVQLPSSLGIPITGCLWEQPDRPKELSLIGWGPCLAMSLLFFIMTVYPFFQSLRSTGTEGFLTPSDLILRAENSLAPVFIGFVTDGAIFFLVIFLVVLINTVITQVAPLYVGSAQSWSPTIYSFASTRLVLSLKTRASRGPTFLSEHFADASTFMAGIPQDASMSFPSTIPSTVLDISSRSQIDLEMAKLQHRS